MWSSQQILACLDLTDLGTTATAPGVRELCVKALRHQVAAVCVWPHLVPVVAAELAGTAVEVATVVNFPQGTCTPGEAAAPARAALGDGATELDVVIPYRAMLLGDPSAVAALLHPVVELAHERGATVKAILETGVLPGLGWVRRAAELSIAAGVDHLKTSTGTTAQGATVPAVFELCLAAQKAPRPVGVKVSGGVRTRDDAERYLTAAASVIGESEISARTFRFGSSSLLDALVARPRH
jgi:deoxyribose-phosphate aldolase